MTLQQISICSKLSSLGSINAVARSFGITQPAVSSALSQLEKELGFQLFIRSKKGIEMTSKGLELLPYFRSMVQTSSDILNHSSKLPSDEGTIKIAGRQGFMQYVFPFLFEELRKTYPDISVETIISSNQDEVIEALTTGRVDICFAPSPKMKSIVSEVIFRDPLFIGIASSNQMHSKTKIPQPLEGVEFCLPSKSDRLRIPLERLIKSQVKNPQIALETDDYTLIGKLIAKGGFAGPIYGHMLTDESFANSVVELNQFGSSLHRELTILNRRDDTLPHIQSAKTLFIHETAKILSNTIKKRLPKVVL